MKVIEVTEKEVKAAFDAAKSDEVKNVLAALFCKPEDRVKPSLDDYKSIKTYEDACEALGKEPVEGSLGDHVDKAYYRLDQAGDYKPCSLGKGLAT